MNYQKKKLTAKDYRKRLNRYHSKFEEFKGKSIEELQEIWRTTKMSSTDTDAIIAATDWLMKQQVAEIAKEEGVLQPQDKIVGEGEE